MCTFISGGLLLLTGAKAALEGTAGKEGGNVCRGSIPHIIIIGMIGYGMAKAAVHQLVHSLKAPSSGLPSDAGVIGILP